MDSYTYGEEGGLMPHPTSRSFENELGGTYVTTADFYLTCVQANPTVLNAT